MHHRKPKRPSEPSPVYELTSALTCIVAPPYSWDNGPVCSVQMGLPITLRPEDLAGVRLTALENVFAVLPAKETSFYLVTKVCWCKNHSWRSEMLQLTYVMLFPQYFDEVTKAHVSNEAATDDDLRSTQIDWLHHALNRDSFTAEHIKYWEMCDAGRRADVDPIWISLYCMVGLRLRGPLEAHDDDPSSLTGSRTLSGRPPVTPKRQG
jgi:hypothetical protein